MEYRVKIRRDLGLPVKPEAEKYDGKVFEFTYGWTMDEGDTYPGEVAYMLPMEEDYKESDLLWIASGDLVAV